MSLVAKYVKTAGTIADKVNASAEKAANIAAQISNGIEDQATRFAVYSDSSLEDTLRADEIARAERAAKLAKHGIDPMVIKERKMQLSSSKVLKDVNKSIKNLSDGLVYQAERFKIASEEALKQTIEESMRRKAEQEARLASLGIDPKVIDEKLDALRGRKKNSSQGHRLSVIVPNLAYWSHLA